MAGLRIVRGANDIAFELIAQDIRIPALRPGRHSLTHPGEGLVPIQTTELDDLAVQFEAVVGKLRLAEAETAGVFIKHLGPAAQAYPRLIQSALVQIPQRDSLQALEAHAVSHGLICRARTWQLLRDFGENLFPVEQLDFQSHSAL